MADAAAGSRRCARRVLLVDLCGAGEAGASARTVGDGCGAGRTCHRVRRNALFDGPGFPAIRGTEIGRSDALTSSKTVQMRRRPDRLGDPITRVMPIGGISPGTAPRVHRISAFHFSSLSSQLLGWHADGYAIRWSKYCEDPDARERLTPVQRV